MYVSDTLFIFFGEGEKQKKHVDNWTFYSISTQISTTAFTTTASSKNNNNTTDCMQAHILCELHQSSWSTNRDTSQFDPRFVMIRRYNFCIEILPT